MAVGLSENRENMTHQPLFIITVDETIIVSGRSALLFVLYSKCQNDLRNINNTSKRKDVLIFYLDGLTYLTEVRAYCESNSMSVTYPDSITYANRSVSTCAEPQAGC